MALKVKEKDVQRAILDWLRYRKVFHYRSNTGAFRDSKKHLYRFGAVGSPDIVCVVKGRYVGIEVKGTGGTQSESQKEFQKQLEAAGGTYIVAYSVDDITNELS